MSFSGSLARRFAALPVRNGRLAVFFLFLAVGVIGLESACVQTLTAYRTISADLVTTPSFVSLLALDMLVPLTVVLLSRRLLFAYCVVQCFLSVVLLHYTIFFYNPLTLSTIYHSMQGAASLGVDIFGFARWDIIMLGAVLLAVKVLLIQLGRTPDRRMPRLWNLRGITAVTCMAVIWVISSTIYGRTGLSVLWVDSRGHRTATERRMEEGTREAVRSIGYVATWIGEWMSGTYRDTALIYAEMRCADPDETYCREHGRGKGTWHGLPVPPVGNVVVFVQVESLDYAALDMTVNGRAVTPFFNFLARRSVTAKAFAPHKVGSCNADYEILNGRVADQNVIYYSYIKEYPDSVIEKLAAAGYAPTVYHGLGGNLFNLREAYAAQGFQRFVFKEELLRKGYAASSLIMGHVRDEDVFAQAAEDMAEGGKRAQFIVTMTSHIPFIEALPVFKSAGGTFSRFVSSLHYVDQCLAAYYATLPEGALLVVWGDHGSDVPYPAGYPANTRHVPFIAHRKGDISWLGMFADNTDMGAGANEREFTLCELAHYLRRLASAAR